MTADPRSAELLRERLRQLPQVDRLLAHPDLAALLESFPRGEVIRALRGAIGDLREEILDPASEGGPEDSGEAPAEEVDDRSRPEFIAAEARRRLREWERFQHRRVINATGIILHTGLGRAVLAPAAVEALGRELAGYSQVEVDLETGERNRRESHVASLVCDLTGAEATTVVNNNAAATLLILAGLARGCEVIISRGQLVEIGGSYRIPSIMEESGARLVEVGATNRTYIRDYEQAITPETGLLLQVHTSNFEIAGYDRHTPLEELVALGEARDLPVVSDLGSGCFIDVSRYGFRREPLVRESVEAGADLVCFSGDKLLGGPQAGIICGRRGAVERLRAHPLFRTLRVDKLTLVALEATLKLYRDPDTLEETLPSLGLMARPEKDVRRRAERFRRRLKRAATGLEVELVADAAQAGSGSLPTQEIPSWALAIAHPRLSAAELATTLRTADTPVFARLKSDRVLLNFRTLLVDEEKPLLEALKTLG